MDYVAYGIYDGKELVASMEASTESEAMQVIQSELGFKFAGNDLSAVLMVRETTGNADVLNSLFGM